MRAIAVLLFAYVWRIQDAFPILGKLQLPMITLAAALAFFASTKQPVRRVNSIRQPTTKLVAALFIIMMIGVPFSLWRGHSALFVLKSFLPNALFLVLVAASVRSIRDVEWFAFMNLCGALVFATVVSLFFSVGGDGRLGNLIFYDANDFALVMDCTIPFAVYFLGKGHKKSRRVVAVVALTMILTSIVKSGSRGGFIGLIAVALYVLLRYRAIPSRVRLLVTVAGVALFLGFASDKYWTMMGTILHPTADYNYNGSEGRVEVWKRGLGYMLHNPIVGVGVAAYPIAEGGSDLAQSLEAQGRGFKWSVAHNSFVETGAELGFPGLAVFIAMLVVTGATLSRISRRGRFAPWISRREMALAQMLIGSLIAFAVAGIFVSAEYFAYLYFLLALAVGLIKIVRMHAKTSSAVRPKINVRLAPRTPPAAAEADLSWVRNSVESSINDAPPKR
ncbi:MAG: O-antigen ligase family protein [Gemmatimonadota bacterium]|nr:O-antigen ligase family protein [Gemmatimonadota bacterium]